jgi:hypothetical protein
MRAILLLLPLVACIGALLLHGPFGDLAGYHDFADGRTLCGVPNFWNVASNVPFALAGIAGLALARKDARHVTLFVGLILTALGSAWYHAAPCPARLVWDRLPLMLVFMSWFAILLRERTGVRLFAPLVALGLGSVLWWHATGDVRWYAVAQFYPIVAIVLLVCLYRGERTGWIVAVLALYAVAKACEVLDGRLWLAGLSGHTWKHLVAGVAALAIVAAEKVSHAKTPVARITSYS